MPAGTGRRACLAVTAALVVALTSGCEDDNQTNGLEKKSAAEVQQDAAAALRDARNVHVTGIQLGEGKPARLDLRIQGSVTSGTVTLTDIPFEITTVGSDIYLKGDQRAWQALDAPPPVDGFAGRWVQLRSGQVSLDVVKVDSLVAQLTDNAWRLAPKIEQATLAGKKVVVLSQQDGSKLYVANTGPGYPLRIDDKKPRGWQVDLSEHGADFQIAAPRDALSNAMTAAESAWLDAVKKLSATMEEVFDKAPTYLSPSAMAALGNRVGGCSRELARIGAPSDRLQQVHALVKKACTQYDKGAECFATAARIGIPIAGSAADSKQNKALDCGFAASAASITLHDAMNKGHEINSQLG